jgi:hypothetical protein
MAMNFKEPSNPVTANTSNNGYGNFTTGPATTRVNNDRNQMAVGFGYSGGVSTNFNPTIPG